MDVNLIKILTLFGLYAVIGLIPLYWASISQSKIERFLSGFMLIFYASFLLTGIAITTGAIDALSNVNEPSEHTAKQISAFLPYIFLGGSLFTFLFGGVGTNVLTSALTTGENIDINNSLSRIERKLDSANEKISAVQKIHTKTTIANVVVLVIAVIVLFWKL